MQLTTLVALLLAAVSSIAVTTLQPRQTLSEAPICAQTCLAQAVASSTGGCVSDDTACYCMDKGFSTSIGSCLPAACTGEDLVKANQVFAAICRPYLGSNGEATPPTPSVSANHSVSVSASASATASSSSAVRSPLAASASPSGAAATSSVNHAWQLAGVLSLAAVLAT